MGHEAHHSIYHMFGLTFHMDTIITTWIIMAIVFIGLFILTRKAEFIPGYVQNAFEYIIESFGNQFRSTLGEKTDTVSAYLFTFFIFILVSNEVGLLPNPGILKSPTSDINTTLALALVTTVITWVASLRYKGLHYFGHFFKPFPVFLPINLLEEFSKPITLGFRLFGNIFAGELLLEIMYHSIPYFVPIVWIAFSIFVGVIQAFIFTLLSTAYIGMGVNEE